MTIDINKHIEDLKDILSWSSNIDYKERLVIADIVKLLSVLEDALLWRKVSDELPKVGDIVLLKHQYSNGGIYYSCTEIYVEPVEGYFKHSNVIEWKPIDLSKEVT